VTDTVLVTGAGGFIGAHLTHRLATLGHHVRALDVRPRPPGLAGEEIEYHVGDIRDGERVRQLLDGVDTVYHLASVHLQVNASAEAFRSVNVQAVEDLVTACAGTGVRRLVHTSSVGIFGDVRDPPADEGAPKRPETSYERTKLAGEEAALRSAGEAGMDVVVVRPAWVYGPGCPRTAKLLRALRDRRFFYVGDGSNLRHPVFVDDMLDGFLLAATAARSCAGRAYIIAGPRAVTLRAMVSSFAAAAGAPAPRLAMPVVVGRGLGLTMETAFGLLHREPPFSRRSLAFFLNDNAFDTSAARRDLGYRPNVDLDEGLRRTLAADAQMVAVA